MWLVAAALSSASGCGGCAGSNDLAMEAEPTIAVADGVSVVAVTASAIVEGEPARDGSRVLFTSDDRALFATREQAEPQVPGLRPEGLSELQAVVIDGVASVYVQAPTEQGQIIVDGYMSVRLQGNEMETLEGAVAIEFTAPPPISAGTNVGGGLAAVTPNFVFECDPENVGAFVQDRPTVLVGCTLLLRDHAQRELPHTPVTFFTEAGEIEDLPATGSFRRAIVYTVDPVGSRQPVDVRPWPEEEPYAIEGGDLIPGAEEQNPRDGVVTLLAVVRGHEAYTDSNNNGVWEDGEPYIDEGEPFLDVDDDGVHDPAIDGPHCCDTNGNGEVDGPNGAWDDDTTLGRAAHIVWTGPVSDDEGRSGFLGDGAIIPGGESTDMTITLVDANYNPPAFHGDDDGVGLLRTDGVEYDPPPQFETIGGPGFEFNDKFPFYVFGVQESPIESMPVEGIRTATFTITDVRDDASACVDGEWMIAAQIVHTPIPLYSGESFPVLTSVIEAMGTLEPNPNCE
jgi:hypothetical protein